MSDLDVVAVHEPRSIVRWRCSRCGRRESRSIPQLHPGDRVILGDQEIRADYVLIYLCAGCLGSTSRNGSE